MSISVLKPGLLTTVQDLGRPGYQKTGLVVSGALDATALRTANLLVGNPETAAGLECTLRGPTLRFETDALLALTGADLAATIGGEPVPLGRPVAVRAGAVLAFGASKTSGRAWLAVAGGVAVPLVLGSRATYLRAALGWLAGRALQAGDVLPVGEWPVAARRLFDAIKLNESEDWAAAKWYVAAIGTACPGKPLVARALPGPEYEQFAPASQRAFWTENFTVTTEVDRMGCRLSGPLLARTTATELLSSAVTFGTVQVPAGGQPIVLLADRQTTGGYPRLAQVITADLGRLAQALPGTLLRFQPVALAEAQALYLAQEQRLRALARAVYLKSLL
ncbi:biotin-dependent carboxyltransferase family protein [Hymenobacter sp. H14-R3]|uniref:5-oxoprolinase subunit C family protein n=1 Tax=Hymenobacter sp. H14-R3 TaxID=3046308 RepID=UPI0024B87DF1|nr:biotin-dependent carboxyltransferase family protein [Hymenobacter sp. H14-R3]MDJ0365457.1 biotin-dependent carboxyltransferase family protein [Hymenobacter sp. H14-R3]